ncbi:MAG: hypothetical protein NC543_10110 [bacterium]|nr:hypothetical protein [bacterium]MCM1374330.1 hypothetical protein [Muribaculum sp.]
MGKISGRSLADKYEDFQDPWVMVLAEGKELVAGDGIWLERTEVLSSVGEEPDMAVLVYRAGKNTERDYTELEKYLEVGQRMEIRTGYCGKVTRIFLGYLHEVEVADIQQEDVEYTLICLDVKGLMRKNSQFLISGPKKARQILEDILGESCYSRFVEKKKLDALPKEADRDCVMEGKTHYDWLCALARSLDFEFFCGRGEFFFRRARSGAGDTLELTPQYGLKETRATVTLTGQTGGIQICGYNRRDEKLLSRTARPSVKVPFGNKLQCALQGCELTLADMELETGAQALWRARLEAERMAGGCARMRTLSLGLPELAAGICVQVDAGEVDSLSGTMYVEETRHLLDENGYRTVAEGVRI